MFDDLFNSLVLNIPRLERSRVPAAKLQIGEFFRFFDSLRGEIEISENTRVPGGKYLRVKISAESNQAFAQPRFIVVFVLSRQSLRISIRL